jgi:hypothetical protein
MIMVAPNAAVTWNGLPPQMVSAQHRGTCTCCSSTDLMRFLSARFQEQLDLTVRAAESWRSSQCCSSPAQPRTLF